MSNRKSIYDSGESRRSPRDRSPARYNDARETDQYRGGGARGGDRRQSTADLRNQNAFSSNRDNFRDSRDSREFPIRDAPKGPKLFEPPSGPRASTYGGDFRGDSGFRGEYRAGRGRGRGRGGWREDSRDRGREADRDFRAPRDDRGLPSFRDERSRDRDRWDRNESFRGRRASSPQGCPRSPTYGNRGNRDGPSNNDFERSRRDSRDGPLSSGPPATDTLQPSGFGRGYGGRGRGNRGRGRGGYYDDFPARNPSPDPNFMRRTQPSATPPPQVQVPAFGSTSSNLSLPPVIPASLNTPSANPLSATPTSMIPKGPKADMPDTTLGPLPGVSVPTAPRVQTLANQSRKPTATWTNPDYTSKKTSLDVPPTESNPSPAGPKFNPPTHPRNRSRSPFLRPDEKQKESRSRGVLQEGNEGENDSSLQVQDNKSPLRQPRRPRRPIIGKRPVELPMQDLLQLHEDLSGSDSGDEFDDDFFQHNIKKLQRHAETLSKEDWYTPTHGMYDCTARGDGVADEPWYIQPFVQFSIDKLVADRVSEMSKVCDVVVPPGLPVAGLKVSESTLSAKTSSKKTSRPATPALVESDIAAKHQLNPSIISLPPDAQVSPHLSVHRAEPQSAPHVRQPVAVDIEVPDPGLSKQAIKVETSAKTSSRTTRKSAPAPIDADDISESEAESELFEPTEADILAVRMKMSTPPLSTLPDLDCVPWYQDEGFLKTQEPDSAIMAFTINKMAESQIRKMREQEDAAQFWKDRYYGYRKWTDFSDDEAAVRSRETFAKLREQKVAEVTASLTALPTASSKPDQQSRGGRRFATEHDLERVLFESRQEAKVSKEREDLARAHTASAKEARVPGMCWNDEERCEVAFADKSHLIPFERSFAVLEFGEPIDNFTEEESELFEKAYLDTPKQWGKIAECLPRRDYKACIQHYYLVKRTSQLKDKAKKQKKKPRKTTATKGAKPKSNALMADINRVEGDDGADAENGGERRRRRPPREAAPDFPSKAASRESEAPSPAPTPGKKSATVPKGGDSSNGDLPTKPKRKPRAPNVTRPQKSHHVLAAAPTNHVGESPSLLPATSSRSMLANPFPQYEGSPGVPSSFGAQYAPPPVERPSNTIPPNFEVMPQPFGEHERLGSAPPTSFDISQDRRNLQQTSSYWSVPEQNDFPALLQHFGTDWGAIAKHMTSKTNIMVYTTVFQQWLTIPHDKNKSRRVANILAQVKNYYSRQIEGKMRAWEEIAREADEKKARGESTGPVPTPTPIPKRRFDGSLGRLGAGMEIEDGASISHNSLTQQVSPPQQSLNARFPALAQAGPPSAMAHAPPAIQSQHGSQQSIQPTLQKAQSQNRLQRGPALGYFSNTEPQRPTMQVSNPQQTQPTPSMQDPVSHSQRSLMAAQEAQIERQQALRLEQLQSQAQIQQVQNNQAQAQTQQAHQSHQRQLQKQAVERQMQMEKDRQQFRLKQETDISNPHQYEQYQHSSHRPTIAAPLTRPEVSQSLSQPDIRRTAPPQQYQPQPHQTIRSLLSDNTGGGRELRASPSPAPPRAPMSAPPASQEQYPAPPPTRVAPAATVRPPKTSNIMSLLNDEPSDPGPQPPKRVSDVSSAQMHSSQTPPLLPQHPLQPSRYPALSSQAPTQHQFSQQMAPSTPQHQPQPSQHSYPPSSQHSLHQHSSSLGQSRSYTPTSFEHRGYATPSTMQQQQPTYAQTPRQVQSSQPAAVRREPASGDLHGVTSGYGRTSVSSQSSMRLKESPYSATPPPSSQPGRSQITSPLDPAQPPEREYYPRQSFLMQQQANAAGSSQPGPTFQQPQPNHRQLAFGQNVSHTASPPTSFATQHALHRSRHNSFDGRYPIAASAPPLQHQVYPSAAPQQGTPVSIQYQPQHPPHDRFENNFDRERRMQEEQSLHRFEQQRIEQQRLEEQRREEQRRRGF